VVERGLAPEESAPVDEALEEVGGDLLADIFSGDLSAAIAELKARDDEGSVLVHGGPGFADILGLTLLLPATRALIRRTVLTTHDEELIGAARMIPDVVLSSAGASVDEVLRTTRPGRHS
jgi:hypothetical protein